jgi:site-specific recombinase XerD
LADAIDGYLMYKRGLGIGQNTEASILKSFLKTVGNILLDQTMDPYVLHFLNHRPGSVTSWGSKCRLLIRFFNFWSLREETTPLAIPRPKVAPALTRAPHIFSEKQVALLLNAAGETQKRVVCEVPAESARILVLMLYATGMTIKEALGLGSDAFAAEAGMLRVDSGRKCATRTIPLCSDLCKALLTYERWKSSGQRVGSSLIVSKRGRPLTYPTFIEVFRRMRVRAFPVSVYGPSFHPILQDFRVTFAVTRISAWITSKADLNRLLPALAVYMGLAGLGSTQKYMALAPERFRTQLDLLSPPTSARRWAVDQQLKGFLQSL